MISRSKGRISSCWQRIGCHDCLRRLLLLLELLCCCSRMLCWVLLLYTLMMLILLLLVLLLYCPGWQHPQRGSCLCRW